MGSKVSGLYRKVWNVWGDYDEDSNALNERENNFRGTIFILKRVSSMFFNEDGDLAHEFYEEVKTRKRKKSKMRKVDQSSLKPQGEVYLQFPKINPDMPVVLRET